MEHFLLKYGTGLRKNNVAKLPMAATNGMPEIHNDVCPTRDRLELAESTSSCDSSE
jgi:hypothetical protein